MEYLFGHPDPKGGAWSATDSSLAETMASYWTNFAATGDPNGPGLPAWPEFRRSGSDALLLGSDVRAGRLPDQRVLASIDRLYLAIRIGVRHGRLVLVVVGAALLGLTWRLVIRRRRRSSAAEQARTSAGQRPTVVTA